MEKNGNKSIGKLNLITALIILGLIVSRLVYIHLSDFIEHKHYSDPVISTSLVRGTIYDRNGNILAIQAPDYGFKLNIVDASPSFISSVISPHVSLTSLQITDAIKKGETFFKLKEVPDDTKISYLERMIVNFGLEDEISIVRIEERKYPSGKYTKEIIGQVDNYMEGISGIEKYLNKSLKATPKIGLIHVQGANAVLTLDQNLQFAINSISLLSKDGNEGAIMNKNGELLAFSGTITDAILENCVLSTSSLESYIEFSPSFPNSEMKDSAIAAGEEGNYYIWASSESDEDKEKILQSLEDILIQQGRI